MDIISFDKLVNEGGVTLVDNNLVIEVKSSWVIDGENRLSYTTLTRLVECCREYHWNLDVLSQVEKASIDSTVISLNAKFFCPIIITSVISIKYKIIDVRHKSYSLVFEVSDKNDGKKCSEFEIVSVFIDPLSHKAKTPPASVLDRLRSLVINSL